MFYRTTLSIYRVAPEDSAWLYQDAPASTTFSKRCARTSGSSRSVGTSEPACQPPAGASSRSIVASEPPSSRRQLLLAQDVPSPPYFPARALGEATSSNGGPTPTPSPPPTPPQPVTMSPAMSGVPLMLRVEAGIVQGQPSAAASPPSASDSGLSGAAASPGGRWSVRMRDCLPPCVGSNPTSIESNLSFACPPLLYGRLSSRLRGGEVVPACLQYAACCCCACCFAAPLRTQLRTKYALPESPCSDGFTHLLCSPCAVWQEYREIEVREGPWGEYQRGLDRVKDQPSFTNIDLSRKPQLQHGGKDDLDSAQSE